MPMPLPLLDSGQIVVTAPLWADAVYSLHMTHSREKRSRKKAESSSESSGGAAADAIKGGRTGAGRGEYGKTWTGVTAACDGSSAHGSQTGMLHKATSESWMMRNALETNMKLIPLLAKTIVIIIIIRTPPEGTQRLGYANTLWAGSIRQKHNRQVGIHSNHLLFVNRCKNAGYPLETKKGKKEKKNRPSTAHPSRSTLVGQHTNLHSVRHLSLSQHCLSSPVCCGG